jgi:hypothetical protein
MHIHVRTGRNRISRGGLMPPGHKPATTRRWIFFEAEVIEWLRAAQNKTQAVVEGDARRSVGRPRKAPTDIGSMVNPSSVRAGSGTRTT